MIDDSDFPEGSKSTELGVLPKEWDAIPFSSCFIHKKGKIPSHINTSYFQLTGKYPIIDQSTNYIAGYTDDETKLFKGPLPVIIFGDHTRIFKFVDFAFAIGAQGTKIFIPNKELFDPQFLFYNLSNLEIPNRGYNRHSKLLNEYSIVKPPLPEQHAVATTLRTVQEAKERTDAVIAATKALKAAMMKHLFTYGPVPPEDAEKVALNETEIGQVPDGWDVQTVDELFDSKLGKMLSPASKTGKFSKFYLRNANVQWGRVDISDLYEMDFSENSYDRYGLISGDVLICEGGEIGRTAIWRGEIKECYYQKAIHRLRPRDNRISPEFFSYHMMYAFLIGKTYPESGTTTTIAHLPGMKLKSLLIPVPPRKEQDKIVTILDSIDQKLAAEQSRKQALDTLFTSLLHDLMTAKIRVTDAGLVPASTASK